MSTFLFSSNLSSLATSDWILSVLFAVLFIAAIVFYTLKRANRKGNIIASRLYGRMFGGFLVTAILGGIWIGLRSLTIPYIGIRFVAVLIIVGFLIWFFFVLKYLVKSFGEENQDWKDQSLKDKYLR